MHANMKMENRLFEEEEVQARKALDSLGSDLGEKWCNSDRL
jgi:hypothetical protein